MSAVYYAAFADLHADIEDMTAGGRMVSAHIRYAGTHKGEFQGIPATGKIVSFEGFFNTGFRC
jgi:predicted ester cyclase